MSDRDSTPTTWPRDLRELWHACAERGEVDASNPPSSVVEAYLQVAEARVRRWASIPWGDGEHDEEEDYSTELLQRLATCAACGAGNLEHFYTSIRRGKVLCAGCFAQRLERGVVREAAAGGSVTDWRVWWALRTAKDQCHIGHHRRARRGRGTAILRED